jgi:hypothetical protein
LQQAGTGTIKFYAEILNWRILSDLQWQDRQIQTFWLLTMILFHFFCLILHNALS